MAHSVPVTGQIQSSAPMPITSGYCARQSHQLRCLIGLGVCASRCQQWFSLRLQLSNEIKKMNFSRSLFIPAVLALVLAGGAVIAQQSEANENSLGAQAAAIDTISSDILASVASAMETMDNFLNYSENDKVSQATAMLDAMEADTRLIISTVSFTSPFMTTIEQTRSEIVTMLRKQSNNPPSPTRDAWLASLTRSLEIIDAETERLRSQETGLVRRLSALNALRADIVQNGKILVAEQFVDQLRTITADLEKMAVMLDEVSAAVAVVPTQQTLAIE